ncbi:MAG: TetR/AcrR family transcriptional regulator [Deltaproteobacteria bacterium]|nr:TetR/AcrR family transcriptional regulator [Deltaproteobacteria bacterium]
MRKKASYHGGGRGDAQVTRERLVDAAAELFNTVGYAGTDSNRIARAAGYAPAMFYKHFEDKRAIFLAAYSRWVAVEWEGIREASARGGKATARRITRRVLEHHRRWAVFRRSLRALSLNDESVQRFRIAQRAAQLEVLGKISGTVGSANRSALVFTLLAFERLCDAIADGEAVALGAREGELVRCLEELVVAVRQPR